MPAQIRNYKQAKKAIAKRPLFIKTNRFTVNTTKTQIKISQNIMKSSSDIARHFQYIILVVLSLFAIILWQSSLSQTAALNASKKSSKKAKSPGLPVNVDTLNNDQKDKFTKKYCPLMKPEEKIVKEFKEQPCNCNYHNVGKLSEARGAFLRKRLKETMLVEVEDITHVTKEGCLLHPEIKKDLEEFEQKVHDTRLEEMRLKDRNKKLEKAKEDILFDTIDIKEQIKIAEKKLKVK